MSETQTWYFTTKYSRRIEPVMVTKATPSFVWVRNTNWGGKVREDKCAINSEHVQYFRDYESARNALIQRCELAVSWAKRELDQARSYLAEAQSLPAEAP